jgi:hypothetical protein
MADTANTTTQKQPKKAYSRPQLQVYGDLKTISQTVASAGPRMDNVTDPNHNFTH